MLGRQTKGIRAPGAYVPGVITAGTFHVDGERVFWDVHDPTKAVVIELADERYARLIVQVADPRATVALLEQATKAVLSPRPPGARREWLAPLTGPRASLTDVS